MQRRTFLQSTLAAAAGLAIPGRASLAALYYEAPRRRRDLIAVTGSGREVTISDASLRELGASLRGRLLLAGDEGYDDARRILNPSFDKHPALIVQPSGPADVRTAVDFARDNGGLLLAVKCGGHSLSGKSTCDRGMMIDLGRFRDVRVDPAARRAWVTGGSLLGAVDHETMSHGLVTPLGTVSHTGVGGLVTGGGFGRVARRFGLSVDNLLSVDVVTADGQLMRASDQENADLFWGVRGGGGNFGIVTSFEFQLHPMSRQVVGGRIVFPYSQAREALKVFADYAPVAPDELALAPALVIPADGPPVVAFEVCYTGSESDAERALAPIRRLGTPIADELRTMDYVALQRSGDYSDPRAQAMYVKSGFVSEVPAALIATIAERLQGAPGRATQLFFQQSGGAIARVPAPATAFGQRHVLANMLSLVAWRQGDEPTAHIEWLREFWSGIEPFTDGFYVNDLESEHTTSAIARNYQANHDRLVAVKNRYDPTNLFRLNANIEPTV